MRIFYTPHESKRSTLIHNLTVLTNSCPSPHTSPITLATQAERMFSSHDIKFMHFWLGKETEKNEKLVQKKVQKLLWKMFCACVTKPIGNRR